MTKMHTRMKRKLGLAHNKSHKKRIKKVKPKTFKTEESAKKYAEFKGIKKYKLVNLRISEDKKKLKIVPEK
ncbi:hypothetical protein CL618_00350 [archaeon]|nr:hypothetical protein [archaeon]|tara:strand:+ start:324 stop:536 length:213 start_codon:yes stop_codon:yes gene_type:complete